MGVTIPTSIMLAASLATSAIGAYAQYQSQSAQAEATEEAAAADRAAKRRQLGVRLKQEQRKAGQDIEQNTLRAIKARSKARTAAGEAGVTGASVAALNRDFLLQEDRYNTAVRVNQRITRQQADAQAQGFDAQYQSRVNSVQPPSFLGAVARVGGDALRAASTFGDRDEDGNLEF